MHKKLIICLNHFRNEGMKVGMRNEYSSEGRKEHNEFFGAMWTEEVRNNPEKLIKWIPELFPDHPDVKKRES